MNAILLRLAAVPVLLVPAAAQCGASFVEGFAGQSNVGGWVWNGTFQAWIGNGGQPGAYVRCQPLSIEVQELETTQLSPFAGDYRFQDVTSLGIDLQVFDTTAAGCQRRVSLVLENDAGTPTPMDDRFVFRELAGHVPCVDGDWHSFTGDVPASSMTLPAGWHADPTSPFTPDATWNLVITDVTRVRWVLGHPLASYAPLPWSVGADNVRIGYGDGPSTYCSSTLNSEGCSPSIEWIGTPSATSTSPFLVTAAQVIHNQNGLLIYGFDSASIPIASGLLCIAAPWKRTPVQASGGFPPPPACDGAFSFDFNAWIQSGADSALVLGRTVYCQYWSRDPGAPSGASLTNGLRFRICP